VRIQNQTIFDPRNRSRRSESGGASEMANYKMDGAYLRDRSGNRVGHVDGNYIKDSRGNRAGQIDGKYIRDHSGNRVGEFDGKQVRDARGSRIASIDDVRRAIDGPGGMTLVALWVLFVR
jgi:hypothetical protein